ncbi:hypothetical protein EDB81DRAFT_773863 [Dactylonectria macrodidyma]|uniref:Uncharacterized protein n=1 Tax=Dactylonectria macrodidyma TaxID=307937 RepID=A0A9P9FWT1_9HYPO|nr:hypothetical protein EDB81DRAFT_773863 [Dactylonectria macrodidyma]
MDLARLFARKLIGANKFRWVFCQLEHMCDLPTDKDRRIALKKLPPTLYEIYKRIVMRAQARSVQARKILQRTLKILAAASFNYAPSNMMSKIREDVSVPDDSDVLDDDAIVDEEEILKICGCLVRKTNSQKSLEFAHFTVQEFLRDVCPTHPQLSAYGISKENTNELLCYLCLRYLSLKNHEREPAATLSDFKRLVARNKSHPFYRYATRT